MRPTESQTTTQTKLARIAWLSARDAKKEYACLMHHFNEQSLKECYQALKGGKATGIDEVDKIAYGERLDENLRELVARMKQMAYRPGPVREVLIPKDDKPNATRALGICNFEDKLVQRMMQKVLESIYEPLFSTQSYGFRPNRGCHDAIKALDNYLYREEVETVIDVDLKNYFNTIDHDELLKILGKKIKDKRFMRYVIRMLKAGILSQGELRMSDTGVPQGAVVSPVLSNIMAHEVIDTWFEQAVKPNCRGKVELWRFADDLVIACQYDKDAKQIKEALSKRLEKYHLSMNEDKTKLVKFSRRAFRQGHKQGVFDYLGFTFYWGHSRKGYPILKLRTSAKKKRAKLKRVKEWARRVRNQAPLNEIWTAFRLKLMGHIHYYGVSHNIRQVRSFIHQSERILFKWLNKRSQRKTFTWEQYQQYVKRYPLPAAKVYHRLF